MDSKISTLNIHVSTFWKGTLLVTVVYLFFSQRVGPTNDFVPYSMQSKAIGLSYS